MDIRIYQIIQKLTLDVKDTLNNSFNRRIKKI